VSLLSNKVVRLELQPGLVRAALWRGRFRPVRAAAFETVVDTTRSDVEEHAVRSALEGLAAQLPIGGLRLEVEVADALVHLDVAEGEFAGLGPRALSAIAEACVAELLGEQAAGYQVRWQLQRDERHMIVGAIPSRWVDAAVGSAAEQRLRLVSLQPRFSVQWNHHRSGRRTANAVFAVADGTDAMIACVRDGIVTTVSNGPWCADRGGIGDSRVDRLLAGVGLAHPKKSVTLIDIQVDRLLASLGVDLESHDDFVLVSADEPHAHLAKRWSVRSPRGAAA
jgi:hypothetical protein